jgi:Fe-S cluster assembly protein SufD
MNDKTIILEITEGVHTYTFKVHADSQLTVIMSGIKIKKADVSLTVELIGPGAKATVVGIFLGKKTSDIRVHTVQQHSAPATASNLLVTSVLHGNAMFSYDGRIRIEKSAQKTDAYQRNENLLAGDGARAVSRPSLEILANDVRCKHGAATGPVDPEELWYLESRGISAAGARRLIVGGRVMRALNLIEDSVIRSELWQKIHSAL